MAKEKTLSWWQRLRGEVVWHVASTVATSAEIPAILPEKGAVIIGTDAKPQWLVFDCPCGKGHRITVTLNPANQRHWKVLQNKMLSVYPSIEDKTEGRHCHFLITNGNIMWISADKR